MLQFGNFWILQNFSIELLGFGQVCLFHVPFIVSGIFYCSYFPIVIMSYLIFQNWPNCLKNAWHAPRYGLCFPSFVYTFPHIHMEPWSTFPFKPGATKMHYIRENITQKHFSRNEHLNFVTRKGDVYQSIVIHAYWSLYVHITHIRMAIDTHLRLIDMHLLFSRKIQTLISKKIFLINILPNMVDFYCPRLIWSQL